MANLRRYRLLLTSLALSATAVVAATPLVAQASVKNPTASSVLSAARTAILKESGVHVTEDSKSGTNLSNVVFDIGTTSGTERISSGLKSITMTVTPTYAFLSGSPSGLTSMMGFSAAQQKKVGSDAITMKAGTTPYNDLKRNLTASVLVAMLPAVKGTTLLNAGTNNSKGYQLSWTIKATSTTPETKNVLTISSAKSALPIKESITSSHGSGTTSFTKWGEHVSVTIPPTSSRVAYSKVFG